VLGPGIARCLAVLQDRRYHRAVQVPDADIVVDEPLVRRLVAEQHPDLADLPVRIVAEGWDNVVLRLGQDLLVRMPRREAAAHLVDHEQRWLPGIADRVRGVTAVPEPVRVGVPSPTYPWPWTVTTWFPGVAAGAVTVLPDSVPGTVAAFLRAMHVPAPPDAPHNPVRGGALTGRTEAVRARLATGRFPRADELAALWARSVAVPGWDGPPLWLHGDLHPFNMVVDAQGLVAVVDFGDVTAGDPATDLATAWLTFDPQARRRFRAGLSHDEDTWARARGWAVSLGTALASAPEGSAHRDVGLRALVAVLDD
jgi:aminoglycoside phosphotransferase (APT) family kinase protein